MDKILASLRAELKANVDSKTLESEKRYFKEPIKIYGVKVGNVNKISKKYFEQVKNLSKSEVFTLCESLFASDYSEEAFIAAYWLPHFVNQFEPSDLDVFEKWINKYINNWAKCDSLCNHTVGDFIRKYPQFVTRLLKWAKSDNRWTKRAAAVTLIVPAKKGEFLKEAFQIADILLTDPDDLVQKGYGWLLKEESRLHQKEVLDYVVKNKKEMPRTALRYAIELMPEELRGKAMAR